MNRGVVAATFRVSIFSIYEEIYWVALVAISLIHFSTTFTFVMILCMNNYFKAKVNGVPFATNPRRDCDPQPFVINLGTVLVFTCIFIIFCF